jgi:hypothetical protein
MPTQIEKFKAHAAHLLDDFIILRERYAMLAPMLFENAVVEKHGSGKRARGFNVLLNSLFLSCSQDVAKLSMDSDDKTPSIHNLLRYLSDEKVKVELREQYSNHVIYPIENEKDPEIIAALENGQQIRDKKERAQRFDQFYCELTDLWASMSTSDTIKAFRTVRDKITAHSEIKYVADKYQPFDVKNLGLKWGDLKSTLELMQRMVELIGMLVGNASFAWPILDDQLSAASNEYWNG